MQTREVVFVDPNVVLSYVGQKVRLSYLVWRRTERGGGREWVVGGETKNLTGVLVRSNDGFFHLRYGGWNDGFAVIDPKYVLLVKGA